MSSQPDRIVVGISGASGVIYGVRLLEVLQGLPVETHLVVTKAGEMTLGLETDWRIADVKALADHVHPQGDIGAGPASGSFRSLGMIILPCSMKTLAELASGVTSGLVTRAADVVLKERRRLVLGVRETPLHAIHLRNMLTLAEMGAIIAPPVPAMYARPKTVDDIVDHTVGRILDLFGIDAGLAHRWRETGEPAASADVGASNVRRLEQESQRKADKS